MVRKVFRESRSKVTSLVTTQAVIHCVLFKVLLWFVQDGVDQLLSSGQKLFSCSACSKNFDKKKSYVYHLKKGRCPGKPEPKKLHKVSPRNSGSHVALLSNDIEIVGSLSSIVWVFSCEFKCYSRLVAIVKFRSR